MPAVPDPVGGTSFRLTTPARPPAVWEALTSPATTPRWLYGIALSSSWAAGDALVGTVGGAPDVIGTVLFAASPERLTYAFEDPGGGVTYLDWRIQPAIGGSVVRLRVDEPEAGEAELQDTWLPVVKALGEVLATQAESRP